MSGASPELSEAASSSAAADAGAAATAGGGTTASAVSSSSMVPTSSPAPSSASPASPVASQPSSSPSTKNESSASEPISALTRWWHGTRDVVRYCLSFGRYGFSFPSSPDSQRHVPHSPTSLSPAATNSSGVNTPFSLNWLTFSTGASPSRTLCAAEAAEL